MRLGNMTTDGVRRQAAARAPATAWQELASVPPALLVRDLGISIVLAFSPLWLGFIASLLVSAYAIPSQSMDATLRVGDVVLAARGAVCP